jgi:hypothetical protein
MKKTTLFLTLCILAFASLGAQNLINNGDLENSAGWAANKRATDLVMSYAANQGVSSSIALKLATTDAAGDFFVVSNNTFFSVTQNTSVKITFWAKGSADGIEFTPFLQETDGNSFTNSDKTTLSTAYQEYSVTTQITSNTSSNYKLKLRGAAGAVGDIYIDDVVVELASALNVQTNDVKSMAIYPNPTNDYLYINEKKNYAVFNIMGQKILNGNSEKIDVRNLNAGIYIISIDNKIKHRFIKE